MLPMIFDAARARPFRLLCLGAHCDDIEIGCGGTVLRLLDLFPGTEVRWVAMTGSAGRREEGRQAADAFLARAGARQVELHDFRESFLPQEWGGVKEEFERLKGEFDPCAILTHARQDGHQDHRVMAELTWNTFRDHLVLEYEIPKFDGDLGQPNLYVPLSAAQAESKVASLLRCFPSQRRRPWFDERTFLGLMRLRGVECNAESGYAEAFHVRKMVV
ncbi:MAG: PIG-L family deacetylase [Magnetospirillum sp.]|nr:PIG-L family deacetylase [Magnetospirillum sp.]